MKLRGIMKLHGHYRAALFGMITLLVCFAAVADSPGTVEVGRFSAEAEGTSVPAGWKPWRFKKIERLTDYTTVREEGSMVVRAIADNSASGLIRDVRIDPAEYPVLHWRWKVSNTYVRGDVRSKDGDDYPARIYLAFDYDPQRLGLLDRAKYGAAKLLYGQAPPLRVINYIWESKAPKDTITSSAYTDWVKMIVVESGPSTVNRWIAERRNVVEDYRRAFGEDPGMITGVAIMTDADNTGEAATAWYGDIVFRRP
jgi:hypothetical protein